MSDLETRCKNGHWRTKVNTYVARGRRCCRDCNRSGGRNKLTPEQALAQTNALFDKHAFKPGFEDACWPWQGHVRLDGYGQISLGGRARLAHRFGYQRYVGFIPGGLDLDHLCRNRRCVNPEHLEPVTVRTNVMRGETLPAINAAKTHCKHGHEFTPENTAIYCERGFPTRRCRICDRASRTRRTARAQARRANGFA
jgi:hypothetical protein